MTVSRTSLVFKAKAPTSHPSTLTVSSISQMMVLKRPDPSLPSPPQQLHPKPSPRPDPSLSEIPSESLLKHSPQKALLQYRKSPYVGAPTPACSSAMRTLLLPPLRQQPSAFKSLGQEPQVFTSYCSTQNYSVLRPIHTRRVSPA